MPKHPAEQRTRGYALLAPPDRTARTAFLLSVGMIVSLLFVFAAMCAGLTGFGAFLNNPVVAILSAFTAVLFGTPYLLVILWLDRNDPEPWWLIVSALGWGAVFATGWSLLFNDTFLAIADQLIRDQALAHQLTASLSAPLVEESTKGTALLVIYLFFRRHFDNVLDGVVYGALVGLGFAVFENFIYYTNTGAVGGVLVLTLVRGVITAIGSHPAFTALTGIGFGLFRVLRRGVFRWALPPFFLGCAMFAHFSWNTFTNLFMTRNDVENLFVAIPASVTVLQLPNVGMILLIATFSLIHEGRMIRRYLEKEEVLEPGELARLVPAWKRGLHSAGLLLSFDFAEWARTRRRARLLIRLAFERWHMDREAEGDAVAAREHALNVQGLRTEIIAARRVVP